MEDEKFVFSILLTEKETSSPLASNHAANQMDWDYVKEIKEKLYAVDYVWKACDVREGDETCSEDYA